MYVDKILEKFHGMRTVGLKSSRVCFDSPSSEFGRAMVHILARCWQDKIPLVRSNEPDMPPKHTKKARLVSNFDQTSSHMGLAS